MTNQSSLQAKGFFATLFDFSFTSFVTLRFLKVIYVVVVVLILLGGLTIFIGFAARGGASFIGGVILAPLYVLVALVFARISLEIVALFFRIGENTTIMARGALGPAGVGGLGVGGLGVGAAGTGAGVGGAGAGGAGAVPAAPPYPPITQDPGFPTMTTPTTPAPTPQAAPPQEPNPPAGPPA